MKFNLKNRPILTDPEVKEYWKVNLHDIDAVSEQLDQIEEWCEGFEKELREWILNLESVNDEKRRWLLHGLKEILGE